MEEVGSDRWLVQNPGQLSKVWTPGPFRTLSSCCRQLPPGTMCSYLCITVKCLLGEREENSFLKEGASGREKSRLRPAYLEILWDQNLWQCHCLHRQVSEVPAMEGAAVQPPVCAVPGDVASQPFPSSLCRVKTEKHVVPQRWRK